MTSRKRGGRRRRGLERRIQVFSEPNRDQRPERIARIITAAGLERARLEADAHAEHVDHREGGDHV